MDKKPTISIVVAAYNVEKFISKCINSILQQDFRDFEVIIVDDGSSDQTATICDEFQKRDNRIKVVHQRNQGLSAVRNKGISLASGEYIAFIDGDDYISKHYLGILYNNLISNNSDISVCGFQTFPKKTIEKPKYLILSGQEATTKLLIEQDNYEIVTWNKLYKTKLFDGIKFPVKKVHEDSLTTYKILARATRVSFVQDPLYYYRQRSGSIMKKSKLQDQLDARLNAATEAKEYFKNNRALLEAAEISEALAKFAFVDNIIKQKIDLDLQPFIDWFSKNYSKLSKNSLLSTKLKVYLFSITKFNGHIYKIYRHIK